MRPDRDRMPNEILQDMQQVGLPWCPHICRSVFADLVRGHLAQSRPPASGMAILPSQEAAPETEAHLSHRGAAIARHTTMFRWRQLPNCLPQQALSAMHNAGPK